MTFQTKGGFIAQTFEIMTLFFSQTIFLRVGSIVQLSNVKIKNRTS
jgi:hypothetical protein